MKNRKLIFGFSLLVLFIELPMLTDATQTIPTSNVVNNEKPYQFQHRFIEQFKNRVLNLTSNHEFLYNCSQFVFNATCDCNPDCDCDQDQLRLRDRIQEQLQDCVNETVLQFLNWFRYNE